MLQTTCVTEKLTMAEVADRCGFNSVSSFNRYFAKNQGMTPTAFLAKQPNAKQ
ncbi:MAG: helix-turn-helix domain-containing protein [Alloprevotella sp.]